jgi:3-dehydroquinate synthase
LLEELGFELFAPELLLAGSRHQLEVLTGVEEFREHLGGELSLTLLRAIGEGFEVHELKAARVVESIHELQKRRAARRLTELLAAV